MRGIIQIIYLPVYLHYIKYIILVSLNNRVSVCRLTYWSHTQLCHWLRPAASNTRWRCGRPPLLEHYSTPTQCEVFSEYCLPRRRPTRQRTLAPMPATAPAHRDPLHPPGQQGAHVGRPEARESDAWVEVLEALTRRAVRSPASARASCPTSAHLERPAPRSRRPSWSRGSALLRRHFKSCVARFNATCARGPPSLMATRITTTCSTS